MNALPFLTLVGILKMMSRLWTVEDEEDIREYKGFNRNFDRLSEIEFVALVKVEDQIEIFVLDDGRQAKSEFVRFLSEDDQYQSCTILGVYKRQ